MWPTPTATERSGVNPNCPEKIQGLSHAVKLWPTPTASDHKGSGPTMVRKDGKRRGDRLDYATERNYDGTPVGGVLNPDWTEWLMAWPIGWTASEPLETGRFQQWLRSHSSYLQAIFPSEASK